MDLFDLGVLGLAEGALLDLTGLMSILFELLGGKVTTLLGDGGIGGLGFLRVSLDEEPSTLRLGRPHQVVLKRILFEGGLLVRPLNRLLILILIISFLLWLFVTNNLLKIVLGG